METQNNFKKQLKNIFNHKNKINIIIFLKLMIKLSIFNKSFYIITYITCLLVSLKIKTYIFDVFTESLSSRSLKKIDIVFQLCILIYAIIAFFKIYFISHIKHSIKSYLRKNMFPLILSEKKNKKIIFDPRLNNAFNLFFSYCSNIIVCLLHLLEHLFSTCFYIIQILFYKEIGFYIFLGFIAINIPFVFIYINILKHFLKISNRFIKVNKLIYENIVNTYKYKTTIFNFNSIQNNFILFNKGVKQTDKIYNKLVIYNGLLHFFIGLYLLIIVCYIKFIFTMFVIKNVKIFFNTIHLLRNFCNNIEGLTKEFITISSHSKRVIIPLIDLLRELSYDPLSYKFIFESKKKNMENLNFFMNRFNYLDALKNKYSLQFNYKKNVKAAFLLKNIIINKPNGQLLFNIKNLEIKKNQIIRIFGNNGSGKTTFLKLLYRDIICSQGKVITQYKRQNISFFFNQLQLFNKQNIFNNILFFINPIIRKNILKNPKYISLINDLFVLFGLDFLLIKTYKKTSVQELKLSDGQTKKIKLITCLLNFLYYDKEILFLDEPFTFLDTISKLKLMQKLHSLKTNNNYLIMVITHENTFNSYFDNIINFNILNKEL